MAKKKNNQDISEDAFVEETGAKKQSNRGGAAKGSGVAANAAGAGTSDTKAAAAQGTDLALGGYDGTKVGASNAQASVTSTKISEPSAKAMDASIAPVTLPEPTITTDESLQQEQPSKAQAGSASSGTQSTNVASTPVVQSASATSKITGSVTSKAEAEEMLAGYDYAESDAVSAANAALAEYASNAPDEYTSTYQAQIDALLEQVLTRDDFSYDFDADPLYQQYKNQYEHGARLAMQDTMAQAQAATGGYGSSYAAQAASGAYQNQINQLTDVMPELYQLAYNQYNQQGEGMLDQLSTLTEQEKAAQALYQDLVANYYTGLDASTTAAENAYEKDYGQYQDSVSYLQDLLGYYAGQEQQAVENNQAQLEYQLAVQEYQESIRQWEAELAAKQNQWQAEFNASQAASAAALAKSSASGAGGSASGTSNSSTSKPSTSVTTLSENAKNLKTTITHEMREYAANGADGAQVNAAAKDILGTYYRTGQITKAEANFIGTAYGASF